MPDGTRKKTKAEFAEDPKWIRFGELYVKNEGNISAACKEHGDIDESGVYRHRRENPEFIRWLEDVNTLALGSAVCVADARLTNAVETGKALPPGVLRTQDQLYKRTDKITSRTETNVTIHNHGVGEKKGDILDKARELGLLN